MDTTRSKVTKLTFLVRPWPNPGPKKGLYPLFPDNPKNQNKIIVRKRIIRGGNHGNKGMTLWRLMWIALNHTSKHVFLALLHQKKKRTDMKLFIQKKYKTKRLLFCYLVTRPKALNSFQQLQSRKSALLKHGRVLKDEIRVFMIYGQITIQYLLGSMKRKNKFMQFHPLRKTFNQGESYQRCNLLFW